MINFEFNGENYRMYWIYNRLDGNELEQPDQTVCQISKITGEERKEISDGESIRSRHDNFSRPTGRKYSLARALHKVVVDDHGKEFTLFDKQFRKIAWGAYFKNSEKGLYQAYFVNN